MPLYEYNGILLEESNGLLADHENCCDCSPTEDCCGITSADELLCTLEVPNCPDLDGTNFPLVWDGIDHNGWIGDIDPNSCIGTGLSPSVIVTCEPVDPVNDPNGPKEFKVLINLGPPECTVVTPSEPNFDTVQCSPLKLVLNATIDEPVPGICGCNCIAYPVPLDIIITKQQIPRKSLQSCVHLRDTIGTIDTGCGRFLGEPLHTCDYYTYATKSDRPFKIASTFEGVVVPISEIHRCSRCMFMIPVSV